MLPFSGTLFVTFLIFTFLLITQADFHSATLSESSDSSDVPVEKGPKYVSNCSDPANVAFDPKRSQCLNLAGRTCSPGEQQGSRGNCVENAHCNLVGSEFHCMCDPHSSYENSEGLCPNLKSDGQPCTSDKECVFNLPCIKGVCTEGTALYGEPCGEDITCVARAGFACANNSCICANPETMVYDKKYPKCFVSAGRLCYENGKFLGDCVDDAECEIENDIGRCLCNDNLFQNSNGSCDLKKDKGESCTTDVQCDSEEGLACVKGTCTYSSGHYGDSCGEEVRCSPRSRYHLTCINNYCKCRNPMVFDKENRKCAVPEGGSCRGKELVCDLNAHCDHKNGSVCRCNDPQVVSRGTDGFCNHLKSSLGGDCSKDSPCRGDKPLHCVKGICSCNPNMAVLDPVGNKCNRKVGMRCTQDKDNCVNNATCKDSECRCNEGFYETHDSLCGFGGGDNCGGDQICSKELDCVEGKCECPFPLHQSFNLGMGRGRCVSYLRGPCLAVMNGKFRNFSCVPNAECKIQNYTGLHECLCAEGYIEGPNRTCVGRFGQNCTSSGSCDTLAGLKCWNGKCACPPFHKYDKKSGGCGKEGEVGAYCDWSNEWKCVEGARCHNFKFSNEGNNTGICQCRNPKEVISKGKCVS